MAARRDPIDRIVDLAIAVPACTLVAARRAVPLAARLGALGTARFVERVSTAVHELRESDSPADALVEEAAVPDTPVSATESAESVGADELPIEGYDDLAARQVVDRLAALDLADLARVEVYEREHRNRSTVLGKISQLTQ
ncbi:MAG: hypothetical protein HKN41_09805 [Ilumatobacter sp.]|nr:hypothetical protein [Ilumatobacter sp.]